ncbi:MAG: cobalamin-dependent protein [Candidatus Adiutrix sp.]|jgi:radical SAM superfamily enzyme YgiQ (UPF0313 family)|nr:cobalamin-dependent protein [Candidatus Adiutrix sp.]
MRVLIVSANFVQTPYPVYPLGAATAAELARRQGCETRLLDLLAESGFSSYDPEFLKAAVREYRPDCVGLSLRNLESLDASEAEDGWGLDLARRIAADIRSVSAAPLFLGGAGFSLMPETVLRQVGAEYGLAGEGETALPAFLARLAAGRARLGLQPAPEACGRQASAYDRKLTRAYAERGGLIGVQTKRGCPLRCLYCSYPLLEGRRIRPRPAEEVIDDIARLAADIEEPHIAFADAVFNDPAGHFRELLAALVSSGLKVRWTAFFQPAEFAPGDLELFKASGLSGLEFGVDGAADATLAGLGKPFDFALVRRLQKQCAEAAVASACYFIFGGPGETRATVEEGIGNIESLEGCVAFISAGLSIYPRTPLHELAVREGLLEAGEEMTRPVWYYSPLIDPAELHARLRQAFDGKRDRLFPPGRAQESARVLRLMGHRGILWDTLIGAGRRGERRGHALFG